MKRASQYINKKSRLIKTPEINSDTSIKLAPFNPTSIKRKLPSLLKTENDFFPCFDWTFPPPMLNKSTPPENADTLFSKPSVIPDHYSIYLHSPFCKSLCSFCYYSVMPGRGINHSETYVDYLIQEMSLYSDTFKGKVCESIYFGGGTPSYLDDELLTKVFNAINKNFNLSAQAEITIEAAPGTLPESKTLLLKSLGVNRLSYGIQTLDEKLLSEMNRDYSVEEAITELKHAIDIIGNVNVDTMYGFDGENKDTLINTLNQFHEIGVPGFSIYSLDKQRSGDEVLFEPPKDNNFGNKIKMFSRAENHLMQLGYKPVLQNIFIDPNRASYKHQLRRWDNLPLIALGINSQGYAPQTPYNNASSLKAYYKLIDAGKLPLATIDELDPELELCRELTSKLRFTYVSLNEFKYKYGVKVEDIFKDLIEALQDMGYIELKHDILRMTDKAAYYNNIIPMLFAPDKFKKKLLGLPEEYLETFPVPFIMTQLGAAQSQPFNLIGSHKNINTDRRINTNRRKTTIKKPDNIRDNSSGRRSTDGVWSWSATSPEI
jgi:coproporphyrinogen III oxidase-like Fe-S oxidoreductase